MVLVDYASNYLFYTKYEVSLIVVALSLMFSTYGKEFSQMTSPKYE